jgi:hypothetical protein
MGKPEIAVIAGAISQMRGHGGLTWVLLQYLLGFKQLGWDVLFLDRLEPEMCVDAAGRPCPLERSINLEYLTEVMDRFGLGDAFSLSCGDGGARAGLSREEVVARATRAPLILNVMGVLTDRDILDLPTRRVFLDIDPGFGQMWRELGLADQFAGHDAYVTIGENIGRPDCTVPTCGLEWITTPQPVVLDEWPAHDGGSGQFTTVASWRGLNGPVEYRGKTYGLRVHEFRKFFEVPKRSGQRFDIALDIHPNETRDLAALGEHGWSLTDPRAAAGDPWAYRTFIQESSCEFSVAKNLYVETASGWFSDRTICYLASGKPAVVQDTGLGELYPIGEGLLTFTTLDEAVAAVDEVATNYPRHARAAREIAEESFDSNKVLPRLLGKLGLA